MMQKSRWRIGMAAAGMAMALGALADEGFDRYQVILERKPFGKPEVIPPPPAAPAEETPPWALTYRLCSVYESNREDVQVALLDTKTNKPVILILGGEPVEGIQLLGANITDEQATLVKDGQSVTMKLTASTKPKPRTVVKPQAGQRTVVRPPQRPGTPTKTPTLPSPPNRPRGVIRSTTR